MDKRILAIMGAVLLAGLLVLPGVFGGRTEINSTTFVENDNPASVATATALDATNQMYIGMSEFFVLRINETGEVADDTLITIVAGDDPPAFRASLGNATFRITNSSPETWIGPFESARFSNATGYMLVNTNASDGTIEAFTYG